MRSRDDQCTRHYCCAKANEDMSSDSYSLCRSDSQAYRYAALRYDGGVREMATIVALFGIVIATLGILGLVRPDNLIRLVSAPWQSPTGLYLAVAVQLMLGAALLAVASTSGFSGVLRTLGVISITAAVLAPIVGLEPLREFVQWCVARPAAFTRAWSLVALIFGAFLVYAVF